jgi:long-chain fatty acid transport protein
MAIKIDCFSYVARKTGKERLVKKWNNKPLHCLLAGIAFSVPQAALATNGMFMIGYGAKSQAMGGVSIGYAQDALASAVNPAALSRTKGRWDMGLDLLNSRAEASIGVDTDDPLSQESQAEFFPIPHIAYATKPEGSVSYGISMVGVGGGGSEYDKNLYNHSAGSEVDKDLGVTLSIAQINPTVSWQFGEGGSQSLGASLVVGIQEFEAQGLGFFSRFGQEEGEDPEHLTGQGKDYATGVGLRLGWMGSFFEDRVTLGLAASSPVYMTPFEEYRDLFAERGRLNTPAKFGGGASLRLTQRLTLAADIQRILYSESNAIGNPGPPPDGSLFPESREKNALGRDEGLGFGWDDQTVYKAGFAYKWTDGLVLRGGWNYGESPIPTGTGAELFNILAPAVVQHHATAGFTYDVSKHSEWSLVYVHGFERSQEGPTNIGNKADISMGQDLVGLTYGRRF